ncbi:PilZ domain-containing protein [Roseibium polysiphoniae]|uniref:PilZ domain-containing protein n=1 Tax=Roseibium polysiphoniae TaxID=2571221 RepID=UPI001BD11F3F|nr:PilZ domain-containing protein [Roseibium polysiphoniae]
MNALTADIPEHAIVSVLVIDLEGLNCIEASASGFNKSGCNILSDRVGELRETIGLRVDGLDKMIRGRVTGVSDTNANVVFEFEDEAPREKRKEKRRAVRIPAQVSDPRGGVVIHAIIVDASKSGCRLDARDLDHLPDNVRMHIRGLDLPVSGRIVWRAPGCAGLELLWQFSKRAEVKGAGLGGASAVDGPGGAAGAAGDGNASGQKKTRKGASSHARAGLTGAAEETPQRADAFGPRRRSPPTPKQN